MRTTEMRLHPRSPFFGLYSSRFYIEKLKGTMTTCIIVIVPMWQGQKDLNPRHAVLECIRITRKAHRYADFKPFLTLRDIIDAILMLLVIL